MKRLLGILSFIFKLYVGCVFVVTLLFFYPFLWMALSRKGWRKYSFPINVMWSYTVRILTFVHVWKINKITIPKGPYLIIANHTSFFDIFLMYSLLPNHRFLFLGKAEILSYPLIKTFFKRLNIPVYRTDRLKAAKSIIDAQHAVQAGWSIVLFPEGGYQDENLPQLMEFKAGAFKLAKREKVPIIALTFLDNYHIFSDPFLFLGPAHPGISRVVIHPVITIDMIEQLSENELKEMCYELIASPLRARGLMHS
jgi:1-acyl-sn-glycerol-3-phosphate acyltransferase